MFKTKFTPFFDVDDGTSAIGGVADTEEETLDVEEVDDEGAEVEEPETEEQKEPTEEEEIAEPQKQSAEDNSKFAEIRRKYESENKQLRAELEAEKASKKQAFDEVVQTAFKGQINPYTEKPIETQEDYEAYQEMHRQSVLEELGLSKDFIQKEIENNPVVRQAEQILEAQKEQAGKIAFEKQLEEIGKLNPNIKSIDDLLKMPEKEEFDRYVNKGYELVDAYRLVYKDTKKKASTADTKAHLIPTGGNASNSKEMEIPQSELEVWKDAFPNEKPEQLRKRYNRALNRRK